MAHIRGTTAAERNIKAKWLAEKKDRTPEESLRLLELRLDGDGTKPDAKLMIAYRESGAFRRVLCDVTGADLLNILKLSSITAGS